MTVGRGRSAHRGRADSARRRAHGSRSNRQPRSRQLRLRAGAATRSLGSFAAFAAGFSYISILTGVFQLFAFGFAFAGPAVWWTWPIVFIGADVRRPVLRRARGPVPARGVGLSVVRAHRRRASRRGWRVGSSSSGSIVTVGGRGGRVAGHPAAGLRRSFQILGDKADAGTYVTKGGAAERDPPGRDPRSSSRRS